MLPQGKRIHFLLLVRTHTHEHLRQKLAEWATFLTDSYKQEKWKLEQHLLLLDATKQMSCGSQEYKGHQDTWPPARRYNIWLPAMVLFRRCLPCKGTEAALLCRQCLQSIHGTRCGPHPWATSEREWVTSALTELKVHAEVAISCFQTSTFDQWKWPRS